MASEDEGGLPATVSTTVGNAPTVDATLTGAVELPVVERTHYERGAEIARGGMGRIVEARDRRLQRDVALKELLSSRADPARFEREVLISARLQHPSIVTIYEAGRWPSGEPFYAMKRVAGRSLDRVIDDAKDLDARLALIPNVLAVFDAMAYAHDKQIIHRDLKPANVLVGEFGETVVIDWGIAKDLTAADAEQPSLPAIGANGETVIGAVMGTPAYMPPEQARGERVDERADVYSLGALLYHVLSGRAPYSGRSTEAIVDAVLAGPPEPLRALVPEVPDDLAAIVDKALVRDRASRYPSAKELAEDLRRFQTGQLVGAHEYSARALLLRWVRRHRTAVVVGAAMLVIGGIALGIAIRGIQTERDRANAQAEFAAASAERATAQEQLAKSRAALLALDQARARVLTNPTEAVMLLRDLVDDTHWRRVRAIAAAARHAGVAYGMPGSKKTVSHDLRGSQLLTAGDDGAIRIHDLASRQTRLLAKLDHVRVARWYGAREIVVLERDDSKRLVFLDAQTGTRRFVDVPFVASKLVVVGDAIYLLDGQCAVWRIGRNASRALDGVCAKDVTGSPDGRWIALWGREHGSIARPFDEANAKPISNGMMYAFGWSVDSRSFAALIDGATSPTDAVYGRTDPMTITRRHHGVDRSLSVITHDERIIYAAEDGVRELAEGGSKLLRPLAFHAEAVANGRDGALIALGAGVVSVTHVDRSLQLTAPQYVFVVVTAPDSPYVVGIAHDRLYVWNLDDVLPRSFAGTGTASAAMFSGDAAVTSRRDGGVVWVDASGNLKHWPMPSPALSRLAASPTKRTLLVQQTGVFETGPELGTRAIELPQEADVADRIVFVDDDFVVYGASFAAMTYDFATKKYELLHRAGPDEGTITDVAVANRRDQIAISFTTGRLWRSDTKATLDVPTRASPASPAITMQPDGTILFIDDDQLRAWKADGSVATLGSLANLDLGRVDAIKVVGNTALIATVVAAITIDLKTGVTGPRLPPPIAISETGVYASQNVGRISIIDPIANEQWELAADPVERFHHVRISDRATRVLATSPNSLRIWSIPMPDGPAATRAMLDAMTNALPSQDGKPRWRD